MAEQKQLISRSKVIGIVVAILAIALVVCFPMLGEDVKNEQIVINQVPITGELEFWTTPGFKFQKFGSTTTYYKTNHIIFKSYQENSTGLHPIGDEPAFPITYSDKGKGLVLGSVRIELPTDEASLKILQTHYGSERRLIEELIKPTLGKVILSCGPLMTSLESVAEKRTDLIHYVTDQLNNGVYATKVRNVEVLNSITQEKQVIAMAQIVTDSLAPGGLKRQEISPFSQYGLKVSQLAIADLKYEQATNNQINKQREADMEIITAKAESAKAVQNAIRAEKEGETEAMKAKWEQEKIKAVEVTKAQQEFEVAQLQAKQADEKAKKIIAEGRAEAESNRLKVAAGLTPLERATIEKETKIGVAEALAGYKGDWTPKVVNTSGSAGSNNQAMDALGIKMMLDVIDKIK